MASPGIRVNVPGLGVVVFPAGTSNDVMENAIAERLGPPDIFQGVKRPLNRTEGAAGTSVLSSATDRFLDPIKSAPGQLAHVLNPANLAETLQNVAGASADQGREALHSFDETFAPNRSIGQRIGSASETLGHTLGMTPGIGPAAAHMAETAGRGDLAGAAGEGVVLGGSLALPEAAGRIPSGLRAVARGTLSRVAGTTPEVAETMLERGRGTLTKSNSARLAQDVKNNPIEIGREWSERLAREEGPGPTTEPIMGPDPKLQAAAEAHGAATADSGGLGGLLKLGRSAGIGTGAGMASRALGVPELALPAEAVGAVATHPLSLSGAAQGAFRLGQTSPEMSVALARALLLAQLQGKGGS